MCLGRVMTCQTFTVSLFRLCISSIFHVAVSVGFLAVSEKTLIELNLSTVSMTIPFLGVIYFYKPSFQEFVLFEEGSMIFEGGLLAFSDR